MAPEYRDLWNDSESSDFTTAVDMWSFGCLIYELFARKCPFEEEDNKSLKKYLKDKVFPREPLDKCGASSESIWLIEKLLEPDPYMRLSAQDAMDSAWLAQLVDAGSNRNSLVVADHYSSLVSGQTTPRAGSPKPEVSLRPDIARIESAPPELVVSSFETDKNEVSPHPQLPTHPPLAHRPASVPESSDTALTLQDLPLRPEEKVIKPALPPRLPPRPRSTNSMHAAFVSDGPKRQDSFSTSTALEVISPSGVELPLGPVRGGSKKIRRKPAPKPTPTLTSTQLPGGHITMDFRNLSVAPQNKPMCDLCEQRRIFNPVIKPAALYVCQNCGGRPLCARCIVETIRTPSDPHEADHKLQAWVQAHTFDLAETMEKSPHMASRSLGGLDAKFGEAWVDSDHTFTAPTGGHLDTLWILNAPPGEYTLAARIKIASQPELIKGSSIGKHRNLMVKSKAVPLGSILFGAQALKQTDLLIPKEGGKPTQHYLPEGARELKIRYAEEDVVETLMLGSKITVSAEQMLKIHIRGSYDAVYFKAGAPYRWWLELVM